MDNHCSNSMTTNPASIRRTSLFAATLSALALTLNVALMPAFAQEDVPADSTMVAESKLAPSIQFVLNEDSSISIKFDGVDLDSDVQGFTFENTDITPLIQQMIESGVMQKQADSVGKFSVLKFSVDNPKSLEGALFGITLTNGSILSTRIKLESVKTSKASTEWDVALYDRIRKDALATAGTLKSYFSSSVVITSVYGTLKQKKPRNCSSWSIYCSSEAIPTGTKVTLHIMSSNGRGGETWSNPIGTTTTDEFGYFQFSQISYCGPVRINVAGYGPKQITYTLCKWSGSVNLGTTWQ